MIDRILRIWRIRKAMKFIPENSVVIDIGCDEGHLLKKIRGKIKKGYGLDIKIEEYSNGNLEFKKRNVEKEEINVRADCIVMLALIEHLNNPKEVLNKVYNSLNKNGRVIITTDSKKAERVLNFLAKIKLIDEKEINDHKQYFDMEDLKTILKEVGFKKIMHKRFELGYNNLIVAFK